MNSSCGAVAGAPCVRHNNIAFFKPTTTTTTLSSSCSSSSCIRLNSNVFITQSSLQFQSTQHKRSYDSEYNNTTTPKPSFRDQEADTTTPDADADAADPELRTVLQLATNSELFELHSILFRPSYFSPLLKSVTNGLEIDRFMIEEDFEERDHFINALESRFLYLAADARSTLRGWRPSYRNVLLDVRKELKIPCSTRLSVEDLEVEIFIFMIKECSRDWDTADAVRVGAAELCSLLLKGGQLVSLMKISQLVSTKLSEKMLVEAAKHKFGSEVIKKGLTGATSRYLGMSSLASLFGPMLWGTFLADVVIQMLGTDYIRILQAIYAFAQVKGDASWNYSLQGGGGWVAYDSNGTEIYKNAFVFSSESICQAEARVICDILHWATFQNIYHLQIASDCLQPLLQIAGENYNINLLGILFVIFFDFTLLFTV